MWPGSEGRKLEDITDELSDTLMLVELAESDIRWFEPRDLTVEQFLDMYSSDAQSGGCCIYHEKGFASYTRGWNAVFADNRVVHFDGPLPRGLLAALVTVDDGKPVGEAVRHYTGRICWKWGRILAACSLLVLAILPAYRLPRHLARQQSSSSNHGSGPSGQI